MAVPLSSLKQRSAGDKVYGQVAKKMSDFQGFSLKKFFRTWYSGVPNVLLSWLKKDWLLMWNLWLPSSLWLKKYPCLYASDKVTSKKNIFDIFRSKRIAYCMCTSKIQSWHLFGEQAAQKASWDMSPNVLYVSIHGWSHRKTKPTTNAPWNRHGPICLTNSCSKLVNPWHKLSRFATTRCRTNRGRRKGGEFPEKKGYVS